MTEKERAKKQQEAFKKESIARQELSDELLQGIKRDMAALEALNTEVSAHWGYEDYVYRYYHQSYKVFGIQSLTGKIILALQKLLPARPLNSRFVAICEKGTGKQFDFADNDFWEEATLPMLQAFFHAKYFLDMVIKYGKQLAKAPNSLPSGWATVLYLYDLR